MKKEKIKKHNGMIVVAKIVKNNWRIYDQSLALKIL